eukprot:gene18079-25373_t
MRVAPSTPPPRPRPAGVTSMCWWRATTLALLRRRLRRSL